MTPCIATLMIAFSASAALAHRTDEYLQATTVTVSSTQVQLRMRMVPGVSVANTVIGHIDSDHSGVFSLAEQQKYGRKVMRDLRVIIDGVPVTLSLDSTFVGDEKMFRQGSGQIRLVFDAPLPKGAGNRHLIYENHHLPKISAYLVNSSIPNDGHIRILSQKRNYRQSAYELDFNQR